MDLKSTSLLRGRLQNVAEDKTARNLWVERRLKKWLFCRFLFRLQVGRHFYLEYAQQNLRA